MEETIDCEFENTSLKILKGWHQSLITWYGKNYMQLPPKTERKPQHFLKSACI
jgi:phosphorylcholine metabolism protein LicD